MIRVKALFIPCNLRVKNVSSPLVDASGLRGAGTRPYPAVVPVRRPVSGGGAHVLCPPISAQVPKKRLSESTRRSATWRCGWSITEAGFCNMRLALLALASICGFVLLKRKTYDFCSNYRSNDPNGCRKWYRSRCRDCGGVFLGAQSFDPLGDPCWGILLDLCHLLCRDPATERD